VAFEPNKEHGSTALREDDAEGMLARSNSLRDRDTPESLELFQEVERIMGQPVARKRGHRFGDMTRDHNGASLPFFAC